MPKSSEKIKTDVYLKGQDKDILWFSTDGKKIINLNIAETENKRICTAIYQKLCGFFKNSIL